MDEIRKKRISVFQAWNQARKLLSNGFTIEEATRLISIREYWEPRIERERLTLTGNGSRLGFVKHLIEHGVFSDW